MYRKLIAVAFIAIVVLVVGTGWLATSQALGRVNAPDVHLPLVIKNNAPSVGPSGALYVFSSTATTTGIGGGRSGMNAVCSSEDSASHFCTKQEIENAFQSTGVYFAQPFYGSWMDYIDLAYSNNWSNIRNCDAWNFTINDGQYIIDDGRNNSQTSCTNLLRVACCKWMP